jgi:hypothetical protein
MLHYFLLAFFISPDAAEIMEKVVAHVDQATEARTQYVYNQKIRSSLIRASGQFSRKEKREYTVLPTGQGTEKKLVSFSGEYSRGKQILPYDKPGFKYKDTDVDGELIDELTDNLVNDKKSRDGIPHSLFPLSSKDLRYYSFRLAGETEYNSRRTYKIEFEPLEIDHCVDFDSEGDCDGVWKGEAWIDAEEFQPVRVVTQLAFKIPWGVRVFLGTNLRQTGFSITYKRVAENVWFPVTYGTEFRVNVLWGYKRTIALSLESADFQKTDASSKIEYQLPK